MRSEDGKQWWRFKDSASYGQCLLPEIPLYWELSHRTELLSHLECFLNPTDSCSISLPCKRSLFKESAWGSQGTFKVYLWLLTTAFGGKISEHEWTDICIGQILPGQRDFSHPHLLLFPVPKLPGFWRFLICLSMLLMAAGEMCHVPKFSPIALSFLYLNSKKGYRSSWERKTRAAQSNSNLWKSQSKLPACWIITQGEGRVCQIGHQQAKNQIEN